VLLPYAIEQSIAEGAARFDKLEGEESYKAEWCPQRREDVRLLVFHGLRGSLERARVRAARDALTLVRRIVPPSVRETAVKRMKRARAH
jgi:CelD/BcsL family acetyltransferase involved in cellulose biosynthesis